LLAVRDDPISTLAMQIVQKASEPDTSTAELARLAEADAGFAVRLLAVVNSPVNGFATRISSVRQAASLLGSRGIQNIALGLCVTGMAPIGPLGELLIALSVRRACAASRIAELARLPNPSEYFATGLLLEVGLLLLAKDKLEKIPSLARTPSAARIVREKAEGITPHPLSGSGLAKRWNLPAEMIQAIEHHHDPSPLDVPFARVAWVAERVAAVFEGGDAAAMRAGAIGALGALKIQRVDAEALFQELPQRVQQASSALGRGLAAQPTLDEVLTNANARLLELNSQYQDLVRNMEKLIAEKDELVDQLKKANAHLTELASTDGLTKLLNRRAFLEAAVRDIARARRSNAPLAFALFDVDHFKRVNDTYGHQVGDDVLRAVANAAKSAAREGDILGRYGGEEFAMVFPNADVGTGATAADRIRRAIHAVEFTAGSQRFNVSASFGVTQLTPEDTTVEAIAARADAALYRAKHEGRNRVLTG
jgi:diguanylate cyclase (GGDEF)-like protein